MKWIRWFLLLAVGVYYLILLMVLRFGVSLSISSAFLSLLTNFFVVLSGVFLIIALRVKSLLLKWVLMESISFYGLFLGILGLPLGYATGFFIASAAGILLTRPPSEPDSHGVFPK